MIISYKHQFIFVKSRKTAGSSIEHYLSSYLGPDDVLIGSDLDNTPSLNPVCKSRHKDWQWIKQRYPDEFENFFVFSVVRNPWDVMVSAFFYLKDCERITKYDSFDTWISNGNIHTLDNWSIFADQHGPVVDQVFCYENLVEDISNSVLPYNGELDIVKKKSGYRPSQDYKSFYNKSSMQRVADTCEKTIKYFDYSF